jgi:hypothetical protein
MRHRAIQVGLIAGMALAAALPLLPTTSAYADYAPASGDVTGVGADVLQYMMNFLADGDAYGDTGYNQVGNKNKLVDFDASGDGNGRLAYGVDGGQTSQTTCTAGTGGTAGTGNSTGTNVGAPCVLNPTIVLRAGTQAVQRPNGSGAGFKALVQDIVSGDNSASSEQVDFARASAAQTTTVSLPSGENIDQLEVGTDTLPMLESTSPVSHAVPLNSTQLGLIYGSNTPNCLSWNDPRIGGTSSDTIIPVIPQVGSGIRTFFLQQIGLSNVGTCTTVAEADDPTALGDQVNPADAIEPINQSRLDLYRGVNVSGTSGGIPGGYFLDPSCADLSGVAGCGTGSVSGGTWQTTSVSPPVQTIAGTPGGTSGGGTAFDVTQPLYLYFRSSDLHSTQAWQPGGTLNWVKTLFYNPGGATPYLTGPEGQILLSDAGIQPLSPVVCTDITTTVTPCP